MNSKFKTNILLVFFGVALAAMLFNFEKVVDVLNTVLAIFLPVVIGLIIAFVLNVPMQAIEHIFEKLFKKWKAPVKNKLIPLISLILTIVIIALVVFLAIKLALPEIISSVKRIYKQIVESLPKVIETMNSYNIDTTQLTSFVKNMNFEQFISKLTSFSGSIFSSVISIASSTVSGVATSFFAIVISLYVLLDKKTLARQSRKMLSVYFKKETVDKICSVASLSTETYSKFLSGQTIEAIILGVLIFISFSIFRLPYAALIAFLTFFFAFIPYVGAFASCAIGAFLILLDSPEKVITCIIVYLVVQFVENQFIYPHVVGNSVGLSPLWTLAAAIIGSNLFGVIGIIFFIPLVAVIYTLVKTYAEKRLSEKEALSSNTENAANEMTE